jgi:hypothetical protein
VAEIAVAVEPDQRGGREQHEARRSQPRQRRHGGPEQVRAADQDRGRHQRPRHPAVQRRPRVPAQRGERDLGRALAQRCRRHPVCLGARGRRLEHGALPGGERTRLRPAPGPQQQRLDDLDAAHPPLGHRP